MEKERLLLCISRYDHYYDSVNNKSNVFLTLSIFVVGGLVAGYSTLMDKVACNSYLHFLDRYPDVPFWRCQSFDTDLDILAFSKQEQDITFLFRVNRQYASE